jgi:predicted dehydrogenase
MTTRREFLKTGAAAAAFTIVPRHVLGGKGVTAPSDKVNIALIGAGGQGRSNLRSLFREADAQVIAVADPAESFSLENFYYKGVGGRKPILKEIEEHYAKSTPNHKCAEYVDFREMLEKETAIDAVLCATPDHSHAYVSVLAMRAGKHVYCEKPLTHNIWEARQVAKVAKETGVATQMGNQGHSRDTIRQTVEWIRGGAIGNVREVHAWVGSSRWNPTLTSAPEESHPVPDGVNWDLWLGPAKERGFHPAYFPVAWRDFWSFGGSNIGDFACHDLDAACWALDLKAPSTVEFHPAGPMDKQIAPYGCIGYYQFEAKGDQKPVKVTWYDGGLKPELPRGLIDKLPGRAVLFVGDDGLMLCGGAGGEPVLLPQSRMENFTPPAETIPRSNGHHRDWLDACKGGEAASSNFEYGARLTELALLGVLSLRSGRVIEWDYENMKAKGFAEADELINEPRRKGWELS